ncbi:MAG: glutaminyl-peptide cyclotransferase [Chitinispirillaceae bacterium]|nr:glutaminyl-peptide cyclotransferase [Chitinispirillaceae bacterium]
MSKLFAPIAATLCSLTLLACIVACKGKNEPDPHAIIAPARCLPRIVRTLPHDTAAFTQGLVFNGETLYESTGLRHQSSIRILDTNGLLLALRPMSGAVFAEGCAVCAGNLYQLTWQERQCFVYTLPGLTCIDTLSYAGEGWGLTANGTQLIMSNGSDTLYIRDRRFSLIGRLPVTCGGKPLGRLNELEFARGCVYANVWFSDYLFEIDPQRGIVKRIIDCADLVAREAPSSEDHVFNGIAYHTESGLFYLTGKRWKTLFVVEIPAP